MKAHRPGAATLAAISDDLPPMAADGDRRGPPSRRRVNLRWLLGTVLTGATSALLIGGALIVAVHGTSAPAATGDIAALTYFRDELEPGAGGRKSDRLRIGAERPVSRQVLQVPTVIRAGDRELIRMKPFVRVAAPLSLRPTPAARRIPPFDPFRTYADADIPVGKGQEAKLYGFAVEGDVTIRVRPLAPEAQDIDPEIVLSADEVERIVRDQARTMRVGAVALSALPTFDAQRFEAFDIVAAPGQIAPGDMPDNMSLAVKRSEKDAPAASGLEERIVTVDDKDTFKGLLMQAGASDKEAAEIIRAFIKHFAFRGLDPGAKLRIGVARISQDNAALKPVRVSIYKAAGHVATVALADEGNWVAAQEPDATDAAVEMDDLDPADLDENADLPSLHDALWNTALDHGMPLPLVRDLIKIFSFDVDFKASARPGDLFEVIYASPDDGDLKASAEILYTAITLGGRTKRFYRFRAADDGSVDYYDEKGKSAKKFLMRKPMNGGIFRSGFGGRRHPVYGVYRMHTGVDWAAPYGTPILASGTGIVNYANWKAGYGRYVKIEHANGYETAYGHMSAFAPGIKPGVRVRQGQVVGYVGSTGVSTGNHLHYEVIINSVHVDPMRVRLPRGRELSGPILAQFQRERERVDALAAAKGQPAKLAETRR